MFIYSIRFQPESIQLESINFRWNYNPRRKLPQKYKPEKEAKRGFIEALFEYEVSGTEYNTRENIKIIAPIVFQTEVTKNKEDVVTSVHNVYIIKTNHQQWLVNGEPVDEQRVRARIQDPAIAGQILKLVRPKELYPMILGKKVPRFIWEGPL